MQDLVLYLDEVWKSNLLELAGIPELEKYRIGFPENLGNMLWSLRADPKQHQV